MPALHLEKGVCQVRQATTAIADAHSNRPVTRKPRGGLVYGRGRLLCWRHLCGWHRNSLGIRESRLRGSTTTFFYIGALAVLTVTLADCRRHAG
jgi:hypothetical protein